MLGNRYGKPSGSHFAVLADLFLKPSAVRMWIHPVMHTGKEAVVSLTRETVFQDQIITSTDLAQGTSAVLDQAEKRPITIVRQQQAFALLLRDTVATAFGNVNHLRDMASLFEAIARVASSDTLPANHPYHWISHFSRAELLAMSRELGDLQRKALEEGSWDEMEDAVYEWRATGRAIANQALTEAFTSESEEVPLTPPTFSES